MKTRRAHSCVAALVTALFIVGCSGGSSSNSSSSTSSGNSSPPAQNPPPAGDTAAPTVSGTSTRSNVARDATISATFNEALDCSTVTSNTFRIVRDDGGAVTGTVSCANATVRFAPSPDFAYATTYNTTLTGGGNGIKDVAGNALAGNYNWSFTTVASTPPPPPPPPTTGTNYFNWGVEPENNSQRYPFVCRQGEPFCGITEFHCPDSPDYDATRVHSGSCSMRFRVRGDDGGNQQMGVETGFTHYPFRFIGGPALYYRWWMRIEPGFSWGDDLERGAKTKSSRTAVGPIENGTPMGGDGYTGYLMDDGFLVGECDGAGAECRLIDGGSNSGDSSLIIPFNFRARADGTWHEYIVKIKPNTIANCTPQQQNCDAQFQAWVDGVSVGEYNNFRLHALNNGLMVEGWGGWMATPYFQLNGQATDGGTIYVDDFSTDDFYNSLLPGGSVIGQR